MLRGLYAVDVGKSELEEDRADVGMLELDGTRGAGVEHRLESPIVLHLFVGHPSQLVVEHVEVIGDGGGDLLP